MGYDSDDDFDELIEYLGIEDSKVARYTTAAGMSTVTRDATSLIYLPATAAEWSTTLTVAGDSSGGPSHLYLPGSPASGNITDIIGGKTLNVSGSPLYQQPITGWSTKCVAPPGTATNTFFNNGTMEDIASNSVLTMLVAQFNQSASTREIAFHGAASTNALENAGATTHQRIRTGANSANGTIDHTTAPHIYWIKWNRTGSENKLISELERLSITFASTSGVTLQIQTGISTDTAAFAKFLYVAEFIGAAAEKSDATIKAISQTLGWTFTAY